MNELKWAEIAQPNTTSDSQSENASHGEVYSTWRYDFLSQFLDREGVKNSVEYVSVTSETLKGEIKRLQSQVQHICIGNALNMGIMSYFTSGTLETRQIGWTDALTLSLGQWWPRNYFSQALHVQLVRFMEKISLEGSALVVGSGPLARPTIAALIATGFVQIGIIDNEISHCNALIKDMSKMFFSTEFFIVPIEEVVTLPGTASILVNTAREDHQKEKLLSYLYYLNFLTPRGLVVDLDVRPLETELLRNSEIFGAQTLLGYEVIAATDLLWASQLTHKTFNLQKYKKEFYSYLSEENLKRGSSSQVSP